MGMHVASKLVYAMKNKNIKRSRILIMGLSFKDYCADIRNSGVKNLFESLKKLNCIIDLYDPWTKNKDIKKVIKINSIKILKKNTYDGLIIAVAHDKFKSLGLSRIKKLCKRNRVIYDLKNLFNSGGIDLRL